MTPEKPLDILLQRMKIMQHWHPTELNLHVNGIYTLITIKNMIKLYQTITWEHVFEIKDRPNLEGSIDVLKSEQNKLEKSDGVFDHARRRSVLAALHSLACELDWLEKKTTVEGKWKDRDIILQGLKSTSVPPSPYSTPICRILMDVKHDTALPKHLRLIDWWRAMCGIPRQEQMVCSAIVRSETGLRGHSCANRAVKGATIELVDFPSKHFIVGMCEGHSKATSRLYYLKSIANPTLCPCYLDPKESKSLPVRPRMGVHGLHTFLEEHKGKVTPQSLNALAKAANEAKAKAAKAATDSKQPLLLLVDGLSVLMSLAQAVPDRTHSPAFSSAEDTRASLLSALLSDYATLHRQWSAFIGALTNAGARMIFYFDMSSGDEAERAKLPARRDRQRQYIRKLVNCENWLRGETATPSVGATSGAAAAIPFSLHKP